MITFSELTGIAIMGVLGLGVGNVVGNKTKVEPVGMTLVHLEYSNGMVTQRHEVTGAEVIRGDWTAQAIRGQTPLCGGGGTAPYDGSTYKTMSVDEWTGDECPPLQPGDKLEAAWEWVGSDNVRRRISGELIIEQES